jgi:hypothetical protein
VSNDDGLDSSAKDIVSEFASDWELAVDDVDVGIEFASSDSPEVADLIALRGRFRLLLLLLLGRADIDVMGASVDDEGILLNDPVVVVVVVVVDDDADAVVIEEEDTSDGRRDCVLRFERPQSVSCETAEDTVN